MSQQSLSVGGYALVLLVLVLLTIGTVVVSFVPLESHWHLAAGWAIATLKGTLVVLFFMHAIGSSTVTRSVIVVSLLFLLILGALVWCDYLTRSLLPYAPGH